MAEQFSEQKPPADTLYAHADGDIRSNVSPADRSATHATRWSEAERCCGQYDKARKEVLDAKNFDKEKRDRIEELLESLAVVKWGYCGPLESRSLCDAFDVTSTFGFEWEAEADDKTAEMSTESSSSSDEAPEEGRATRSAAAAAEAKAAAAAEASAAAEAEPEDPWAVGQGMYDAMMLNGYGEVISILSKDVPVALRAPVTKIEKPRGWGNKVKCTVSGEGMRDAGYEVSAEAVIVTVSIGVLQAGKIAFNPSLPAASDSAAAAEESEYSPAGMPKTDVIDALGFGFENKVVVRFDDSNRFWAKTKGGSCSHWQTRDQRFRFVNGDALGKRGTIIAHVGPPFSVEYKINRKYYNDKDVVREVCATLQEMFALDAPPVPVDSHVTRWAQDELAKGSYSYQKVYSGSDMCDSLAVPEWGGRLCFAGEACCQDRVQCVDGALVTGRKAADTVAALANGGGRGASA